MNFIELLKLRARTVSMTVRARLNARTSAAQKGFTLIEMSVVLMIAGIITTAAMNYYQSDIKDGRAAEIASELTAAESGLRRFVVDNHSEYVQPASSVGASISISSFTPAISGIANVSHPTSIELKRLGYLGGNIGDDWVFTVNYNGKNGNNSGFSSTVTAPNTGCSRSSGFFYENSGCDIILMGQKVNPYLITDGSSADYPLLGKIINLAGNIAGYSGSSQGATSTNDGKSIRGVNNQWIMDILDSTGAKIVGLYASSTVHSLFLYGSPWVTLIDPALVASYKSSFPPGAVTETIKTYNGNYEGYLGFFSTINNSILRGAIKNQLEFRALNVLKGVTVNGNTSLQFTANNGVLNVVNGKNRNGLPVFGTFSSVGLITSMNTLSSTVNAVDTACAIVGSLSKNINGLALSCIQTPAQGLLWKLTSEVSCPSGGALVTISKPVAVPLGCNNVQIVAVGGGGGGGGGLGGGGASYSLGVCDAAGADGLSGIGGGAGLSSNYSPPYGTGAGKMFYVNVGQGGIGGSYGWGYAGGTTLVSDAGGVNVAIASGGNGGGLTPGWGLAGANALVAPVPLIYSPFVTFQSLGGVGGALGVQGSYWGSLVGAILFPIKAIVSAILGAINGLINIIFQPLFQQSLGLPTGGPSLPSAERDGSGGGWGNMAAGGGGGGGGAGAQCYVSGGGLGAAGGNGGYGYAIITWTK